MSDDEWLNCDEPSVMLDSLRIAKSDRKLRLFAAACCRRIWHLLSDERSRRGVDVAESYFDGLLSKEVLQVASQAAHTAAGELNLRVARSKGQATALQLRAEAMAATAACVVAQEASVWSLDRVWTSAELAAGSAASASAIAIKLLAKSDGRAGRPTAKKERASQCDLLRDIFCNPFHPVTADPSWLTPTIITLAQTIYSERTFDRLPAVAAALEAAGCADQNILTHCRNDRVHVRGCWVLDLVLGKK